MRPVSPRRGKNAPPERRQTGASGPAPVPRDSVTPRPGNKGRLPPSHHCRAIRQIQWTVQIDESKSCRAPQSIPQTVFHQDRIPQPELHRTLGPTRPPACPRAANGSGPWSAHAEIVCMHEIGGNQLRGEACDPAAQAPVKRLRHGARGAGAPDAHRRLDDPFLESAHSEVVNETTVSRKARIGNDVATL